MCLWDVEGVWGGWWMDTYVASHGEHGLLCACEGEEEIWGWEEADVVGVFVFFELGLAEGEVGEFSHGLEVFGLK